MPSPVKSSGCRKIFSLDIKSSEVDDGKNDAIQDSEKNQTICVPPERVRFDNAAINASLPSTTIIHKDPLISGQMESLIFDYITYRVDQAVFNQSRVNAVEVISLTFCVKSVWDKQVGQVGSDQVESFQTDQVDPIALNQTDLGRNLIISTLQLYGQLLRSAQETGNKKAESMASHQQTPNEHSLESVMNHGNFLNGSVEAEFSRLTEHLVFAFLGGYMSMDNLPCLGDLANGIDEFHRTTSSSINSYSESSQAKTLDQNGNHHQLSAVFMNLDFVSRIVDCLRKSDKNSKYYQKPVENLSILLDTFDASSTAYSSPEHTSQKTDEMELLPENSIDAHLICNKIVMDILNLDCPATNLPFQKDDFPGKVSKINNLNFLDFLNCMDSNSDLNSQFKKLTFKLQKIDENQKEYDLHEHALTSGNLESQFHRQHKNLNDVPLSNPCSPPGWNNKPINDGNTFSIPNPSTLMDYLYGDLEIPQFQDTESSTLQPEDSCCTIGNNGEGSTFSVPDPSQLMNFLYGDLESPVFLSSESIEEEVPIYAEYDGNDSKVEVISLSADHIIGESHQCSSMSVVVTSETIAGLMTESLCDSNGFTNGMNFNRVRMSSSSQFEKESSEISDSKLCYNQDEFNVADHFDKFKSKVHNTSATEPKGSFPKNPTTFVPTTSPLLYKSEDDEENMTTDLLSFASNTEHQPLMNKNSTINFYGTPEIYVSSPCYDQKVCLLGDYGSDDDAEVTDLSDFMRSCLFGNGVTYNTPSFPIKSKIGSLAGAFEENEITPTSSALFECNGETVGLDSSFFDLSDHDDLLEVYGLSNQEQYTDTEYTCESPSWPGKSERQIQKSLTSLTSNLTKNDNSNETSTADSSLFHSNTDETFAMNKKWTDEINKRNSEISVSPCYLNQMECAFETSFIPNYGSIDCVHSCSDDSGDSIEHQSFKNDKNELKFGFPDPSALKDYIFGSLDSPKFLASELLDGKIDNLHYPSLFGGCEQGDRTEEAGLSGKMILDQFCQDLSRDDNSINKFSCSIQLLDVTSYPFDISDHDEFLEWYGINDQDQFMGDDWMCDSPTWPGKI